MREAKQIHSTCLGCVGNCGAFFTVEDNKIVQMKGDPDHPITRGFTCVKGRAVEQIRSSPERLKYPLKRKGARGSGQWDRISWDEALEVMSGNLSRAKEEYGAESVVIAIGHTGIVSGLNTPVRKFLHEFGSPNCREELNN